ncbi:cardiolipin synthase B [Betaproteobacteria bacterium]|nr:cardiolipin synthase B [Betaproteobacteria bacterium]
MSEPRVKSPLTVGNAIALLHSGREYFPALEAAIDEARAEVMLQTYIFAPDQTGRRIAAALVRAVGRGVAVRVVVDGFGSQALVADKMMDELLAAGVEVLIFRRGLRLLSFRRNRLRRMHRKVVVIDDRLAFVGGINIVDDFTADATRPFYDYAVRVEGPLLEPIVASVRRLWRLLVWVGLRRRARAPHGWRRALVTAAAGTMQATFLVRDNLRHRNEIENAYLGAIALAGEEILIANAYFFPSRRFRRALYTAVARGVKVTLLLQGVADHPLMQYATRALYPRFLERGIRLFEYRRSMLHAKVAVIDRHWATVGSSNIDPFSLLLAREANVVVIDDDFAATLETSLRTAISTDAEELRPEDLQRASWLRRMLYWLACQTVRLATGIAGYGGRQ